MRGGKVSLACNKLLSFPRQPQRRYEWLASIHINISSNVLMATTSA